MKRIESMLRDIQRGENVELYVTLIAAIVLSVLTVIGVTPAEWIAPLTLVVLAALAYSMLGNRYQIERAYEQITETTEGVLLQKWPGEELKRDVEKATNLLIIGISLQRTIRANYALLERKLKAGGMVRILLVEPDGAAIKMATDRVYSGPSLARTQADTQASLNILINLGTETSGGLEMRLLDYLLPFGGFVKDSNTARGVLYLKHFTFKMPSEDIPRIIMHPQDGYWYDFYSQQAEVFWSNAKPYSF